MPFALLIIGLVVLVAGARGQSSNLLQLVDEDFLSEGGYIPWAISILGIGAVGYIPKMKPISDAFILLVIIVLILANKGFFANFQTAIASFGSGSDTLAGSTQTSSSSGTTSTAATGSSGVSQNVSSVLQGFLSQLNGTTGSDAASTGDATINVSSNPSADLYADGAIAP